MKGPTCKILPFVFGWSMMGSCWSSNFIFSSGFSAATFSRTPTFCWSSRKNVAMEERTWKGVIRTLLLSRVGNKPQRIVNLCHQFLQFYWRKQWVLVSKTNSEWEHPFYNIRCPCWSAERSSSHQPSAFLFGKKDWLKEVSRTRYWLLSNS